MVHGWVSPVVTHLVHEVQEYGAGGQSSANVEIASIQSGTGGEGIIWPGHVERPGRVLNHHM